MIAFKMSVSGAKRSFFDKPAIVRSMDRAKLKVLSKFGAYVRTRAMRSIRNRKKPSAPGQPPSSHTGLLKKLIFFSYDKSRGSVVIGPAVLNGHSGDALPALEYGGDTTILDGHSARDNRRRKRITVRARPFMGPAFEEEKKDLPALWGGSVK